MPFVIVKKVALGTITLTRIASRVGKIWYDFGYVNKR
jgi:hypothetical protein